MSTFICSAVSRLSRTRHLSRLLLHQSIIGYISKRHRFTIQDTFQKTTADFVQEDETVLVIESYNTLGFKLNNGIQVFGPAVFFPKTVLHWNVNSAADVNEDSLSLFTVLEPKLDILIIGKGEKSATVNPLVIKYINLKKIGLEVLPTEQAIALYNYLVSERRVCAAALIPPRILDEDSIPTLTEPDIMLLGERDMEERSQADLKLKSPQQIRDDLNRLFAKSSRDINDLSEDKMEQARQVKPKYQESSDEPKKP